MVCFLQSLEDIAIMLLLLFCRCSAPNEVEGLMLEPHRMRNVSFMFGSLWSSKK